MRIVVSNSDEDLAADELRHRLRWLVRDLTANLMRIARGAGRPEEVGRQVRDLAEAFDAADALPRHIRPREAIAEALDLRWDYDPEHPGRYRKAAEETVVLGTLRMVAARYLGQHLQEDAGEKQLMEGIREFESLRKEARLSALSQMMEFDPSPPTRPRRRKGVS